MEKKVGGKKGQRTMSWLVNSISITWCSHHHTSCGNDVLRLMFYVGFIAILLSRLILFPFFNPGFYCFSLGCSKLSAIRLFFIKLPSVILTDRAETAMPFFPPEIMAWDGCGKIIEGIIEIQTLFCCKLFHKVWCTWMLFITELWLKHFQNCVLQFL